MFLEVEQSNNKLVNITLCDRDLSLSANFVNRIENGQFTLPTIANVKVWKRTQELTLRLRWVTKPGSVFWVYDLRTNDPHIGIKLRVDVLSKRDSASRNTSARILNPFYRVDVGKYQDRTLECEKVVIATKHPTYMSYEVNVDLMGPKVDRVEEESCRTFLYHTSDDFVEYFGQASGSYHEFDVPIRDYVDSTFLKDEFNDVER